MQHGSKTLLYRAAVVEEHVHTDDTSGRQLHELRSVPLLLLPGPQAQLHRVPVCGGAARFSPKVVVVCSLSAVACQKPSSKHDVMGELETSPRPQPSCWRYRHLIGGWSSPKLDVKR
jgi:hypothetical protein